ncbi:alpha-ketoglutarate dehydrogenase component 4-like [Acinonyx jubatus]|uniref:Alpha-ketoglutarate dehydrogenase component 4-like n=1 Tax=Acinonyx jubatus TaxID=32536 RepID=A0ABM3Q622_ACIJB|nr:alpha-ketoglutarate dehydrogenase component 4-like [Acinonyx jubatus]
MMGTKMASASKVIQVVKPHIPLRFPDRRHPPRRDNSKVSVSEALCSVGQPSQSSSISQHSKGGKSPDLLMHLDPPDTAQIIKALPQKYRKKLVSQEEIECIQCGGPKKSLTMWLLFVIKQKNSPYDKELPIWHMRNYTLINFNKYSYPPSLWQR